MPNDMMIPAVQAIASTPQPRPARTTTAEPRAPEPRPYVNPTLRLEPDLGLVVMEFRDDAGKVTTIPNERQLAAYRAHQEAAGDLASARNAIETSAGFPDVEGFAEPQARFGEPSASSANGSSQPPVANPAPPPSSPAPPATSAPVGLTPPGPAQTGTTPTAATPTGSAASGPAQPGNDGSAPVAGPKRG